MANLMTFRTRIGFSVLLGPFIVMGSVLIATEGRLVRPTLDWYFGTAVCAAAMAYFGLGVYGAMLDKQMTRQCDRWRKAIIAISQDTEPSLDLMLFRHHNQAAYFIGFMLHLIAFLSLAYCISQLLPNTTNAT